MPKGRNIFDDESEDESFFEINQVYAAKYDDFRSKEELAKLKAREPADIKWKILEEESSSEEEYEDGKDFSAPRNPEFDKEFLTTLGTIYTKSEGSELPKDVEFFKGDYRIKSNDVVENIMTVKDLELKLLVEGHNEDDEVNAVESEEVLKNKPNIKFFDGLGDSDEEDADELLASGLFKKKPDNDKGKKKADSESAGNKVLEYLKGEDTNLPEVERKEVLDNVKGKVNSDKLSKKDKWLFDFFLNERYVAQCSDDEYDIDDIDDIHEDMMSDEEYQNTNNPLSAVRKFRHQEPGDFIKSHPRNISDSLRPKDERRAERRKVTKEHQLMKKQDKRREIEMLKQLKYQEIQEKINRIRDASGNEDIDLGEVDLQEDFDPESHEKFMEKMLGDNYYDEQDEEGLPEFTEEINDEKNYNNWTGPSNDEESNYNDGGEEEYDEDYYEDGDFNMDADAENAETNEVASETKPGKKGTRRGKRRSKFVRALEKKKPLFDPKVKGFDEYFDEYYQLDFEDVVGGIPCRFKYRKVESNDFGLTTGEILTAQDADLNRWIGLKKIMQYNRNKEIEDRDRERYTQRASQEHAKQKLLPSLYTDDMEDLHEKEREKRRLKQKKRRETKQKRLEALDNSAEKEQDQAQEDNTHNKNRLNLEKPLDDHSTEDDGSLKKKKKKHRKGEESLDLSKENELSSELPAEEAGSLKKKKKKHRKGEESLDLSMENGLSSELPAEDDGSSKKKKKKHRKGEESLDLSMENELNRELPAESDGSPKKKKKKHTKGEESLDLSMENGLNSELPTEDYGSSKKKKKKHTKVEVSLDSSVENGLSSELPAEDDGSPKKKKKKDKMHAIVEESSDVPPEKKKDKNGDNDSLQKLEGHSLKKMMKNKKDKLKFKSGNNPIKKKKHGKFSNRKNNRAMEKQSNKYLAGISDARLEAYGQNPKKIKNRVLYGKDL